MSDFEERVRRGLASGADPGEWDGRAIVAGAKRRARRRRRRTVALTGGATMLAVLAAGGILWGPGQVDDGPKDRPAAGVDGTGNVAPVEAPVADGWRFEYADGLEFMVPGQWGLGARSDWCIGSDTVTAVEPRVDRGEGRRAIGCSPAEAFGVSVGSSAALSFAYDSGHVWRYGADEADVVMHPDGAWLGYWYSGDRLVQVASADRKTTQRIVESVRQVEATQEASTPCPVTADTGAGPLGEVRASMDTVGAEVTVCRYVRAVRGAGWALSQAVVLDDAGQWRLRQAQSALKPSPSLRRCARKETEILVVLEDSLPTMQVSRPCETRVMVPTYDTDGSTVAGTMQPSEELLDALQLPHASLR